MTPGLPAAWLQSVMCVFRRLCCAVLLANCAIAATPARPNIILVTLDTVRADRMGFLGSQRGLTPNLDALARQSVVFTRAYSQVPLTNPSHATILTGTYPQFNHVNDFAVPLAKDLPDLPDILHEHGYGTAAFVGSSVLDPKDGLAPGFDRGFDTYDAGTSSRRGGEQVVESALAWLKEHSEGPFFLWIHLYDPHAPYEPPEPFRSRHASDPYDGAIAYADSALGNLLTELRTRALYNNAVIALMADHGEAFGEHGERQHGIFLYDETIQVPLLFKMPNAQHAGKRIDVRARLVDVAPTILQILGLPVPVAMQGQSLLSLLKVASGAKKAGKSEEGEGIADRPVYSETDYPHRAFGWSSLRAFRSDKYLFIEAPRKELYNQSLDLGAEHNIFSISPAVANTLNAQLDEFRRETSGLTKALKANNDARLTQNLSALGYVASTYAEEPRGTEPMGADPKDKIEVANKLVEALILEDEKRYQEEIPLLLYVLAQEPDHVVANLAYGKALVWLHNSKQAVLALRKALASRSVQADTAMTHYLLGVALFETEDWKGATHEFETAVSKSPRWADAHFSLASVYERTERMPEARKELGATLEIEPDHYAANVDLGLMLLTIEHDPAAALPMLKKASRIAPQVREVHLYLARTYARLGRDSDASRELAEADRLKASGHP